jgi:hypothetical protein
MPRPLVTRPTAHGELVAALAIAWLMVIGRSAVYVIYEHAFFDSDQANFGLMAKHLMEGRAFPLFVYGQSYMLAVDAWLAVPFFVVAGPSVAALHSSLVASNLIVVTMLIVTLWRAAALRPLLGLVSVTPFALAPPDTAASLLEAAGNIGPFVYVPLLWLVRDRPLWFGLVLGVGFLHREFTAYAVPVFLFQQAARRTLWRPDRVRLWLIAAAVTLATWQSAQALRQFSDPLGPGTRGRRVDQSTGVGDVTDRIEFVASELPVRISAMLTEHLPGMLGGRHLETLVAAQGHDWLYWPLMGLIAAGILTAALMLARAGPPGSGQPDDHPRRTDFPIYLSGVGLLAIAGYVVTRPADFFVDRYMLLAMYLPVGAIATVLAAPAPRWLQAAVAAVVGLVAIGAALDHVRHASRFRDGSVPNELRGLADALVDRGITVASAGYWRAYKLTFLTGERVKIAANDYLRIEEYQRLAEAEGERLITIQEEPCAGGERLSGWYLCRRQP